MAIVGECETTTELLYNLSRDLELGAESESSRFYLSTHFDNVFARVRRFPFLPECCCVYLE